MKKIMMIMAIALALVLAGCSSGSVTHTVTFYSEGAVYKTVKVADGGTVGRPTDPVRDGYEFTGWYKTAECDGEPYGFGTKVKSGFSLYAGWKDKDIAYEPIGTAEEFMGMDRAKAYRLLADIDLSGVDIPAAEAPFSGTFDGNGHTVTGFKLARAGRLFGTVTGTVKNLCVTGASIKFEAEGGTVYAGIVADRINGGRIENCFVKGNINVKNTDTRLSVYAGLVAGRSYDGDIIGCTADGDIDVNNVATAYAGGIVAYNGGEGEALSRVLDCRYGGNISALSQSQTGSAYVGGIAGYNAGEISGSFGSDGKLVGTTYHYYDFVGGIAGDNNGGQIRGCLGVHDIKAETWHGGTFAGGVVGHNFLQYVAENCFVWDGQQIELNVTDSEYYKLARHNRVVYPSVSAQTIASESFQRKYFGNFDSISEGYFPSTDLETPKRISLTPAKGTRGDPILISDKTQLLAMDSNKSYKLTADIDALGETVSIGTYEHPFYGSLDGDGHTVKGISPVGGNDGAHALFGYFSGNVENLNVVTSYVPSGAQSGLKYVAGLVAYSTGGRIYNCTASVTADVQADGALAGGIVAYNDGGAVDRCDASGTITVTAKTPSAVCGGITGVNRGGRISHCTSSVNVTVTGADYLSVGGTVGKNEGDISFCLNIGTVNAVLTMDNPSSTAALGGIVGTHLSGIVDGCFAIDGINGGGVHSVFISGGIVGVNRAAIKDCCYICDSVDYGAGYSKDEISAVEAEDTAELEKIIENMDGDVWTFDKETELPVLNGREVA